MEANQDHSLTIRLLQDGSLIEVQEKDGKCLCPHCNTPAKNMLLHLQKMKSCQLKTDMTHFMENFKIYKDAKERARKKRNNEKRKLENPTAFLQKNRESKKKSRAKLKLENPTAFLQQDREGQKKSRTKKKLDNEDALLQDERNRRNASRSKKKLDNEEALLEDERSRRNASRSKKKLDNEEALLEDERRRKKKSDIKISNETDEARRRSNFSKAIIFGPIFICACCSRKLFEKGVSKITQQIKDKINAKNADLYDDIIDEQNFINIKFNSKTDKSGLYLCHTCKGAMERGKMPAMAAKNGLDLIEIEEDLKLTEMENNLIAQNINFQYIYCLPKSRWSATKKQMISVPVSAETVQSTVSQLPRLPKDAGLIPVNLKRKKEYKNAHKKEFIDPEKIFRVLDHLKSSGHPYYQFESNLENYEDRCREEDSNGHNMIFPTTDDEDSDSEEGNNGPENDGDKNMSDEEEDTDARRTAAAMERYEDYIRNDPIRKHQFENNTNTCLTNNHPEIFLDKNGRRQQINEALNFSPAEGNTPINILQEKDWDIKSWPSLHADGKFGLHHKRKVRLTDQQYFGQRILNKDTRFADSPGYIFNAASFIEQKQLNSKANISFMRGKKTESNGIAQYELNDDSTVFQGIKNTPKYWQEEKRAMISKIEAKGPFEIFFTLSCGDSRYDENFSSFLKEKGYELEYLIDSEGNMTTYVLCSDGTQKELRAFLDENLDESLHEMIRTNVLNATRNFQNRVEAFRKEIIMGKNSPFHAKYISYRIEFQARGAAHIHGVLWLDMEKIEEDLKRESGEDIQLVPAFKKLKYEEKLSAEEKKSLEIFTDKFITCSLNPDIMTQEVVDIVQAVNIHRCTIKCNNRCKYGFPRYPVRETTFLDKKESVPQIEDINYQNILININKILNDEDTLAEIQEKYPNKGRTKSEIYDFRSERIDEMLRRAGDISYENYINAIRSSKRNGSTVLLERDLHELHVNNYNPEWIRSWDSNLDIQIVPDMFGVITYVTDYWLKPDKGMTQNLEESAKQLRSEPDMKKRCQQLANTFLSHRQMGIAEAYYKIFPQLSLKYSNIATVFVPADKRENRSRFLMKLNEDDPNYSKGALVQGGREGMFLEKADIVDRYCRRNLEKHPELEYLTLSQFAMMYEPINARNDEDEEEERKVPTKEMNDDGTNEEQDTEIGFLDKESMLTTYILTPKEDQQFIPLPKFIKATDTLPGEIPLWKKRRSAKAMRIHRKREDTNPHGYCLAELMLYTPFLHENDLGGHDEEKCRNLYHQNEENIQYIKGFILPYAKGVEEARFFIEEGNRNEDNVQLVGDNLDPQMEQDIQDLMDEEEEPHPDYFQIDPENHDFDESANNPKRIFRNIETLGHDQLLEKARRLDPYQKLILNRVIRYAQDIKMARKGKIPVPEAPLLLGIGGAGSGKSTVIDVLSQYFHKILQEEGDDPDCPHILLSAFTGSAAENINGQTLHTLLGFTFGTNYQSLGDKSRDAKRALFRNVKCLVIDEISLIDPDMLYKIDLRFREIKQIDKPFGNIAILAFGDIMQIKPVMGRYAMERPIAPQSAIAFELDSTWHKFEVIVLEKNHRQGEDKIYADMLNRIRVGEETEKDMEELEARVRAKDHEDIKNETKAIYLYGTNENVNRMNNLKLKDLPTEEIKISAILYHRTLKNFEPSINNAGNILNTPFQKELRLKIGARVMITYNVDTCDGLNNGAIGELIDFLRDAKGEVCTMIIKFEHEWAGREMRNRNRGLAKKYPGGTPIEKIKYPFSISKSQTGIINSAYLIQFPLKLAFACTGHKIQGLTVHKPLKVIVSMDDIFAAAIIYVMLSRINSIEQLYILDKFDRTKIYPSKKALAELRRLHDIALNKRSTEWDEEKEGSIKIISLNCRSLKKHFEDIIDDDMILKSHIICLQETWIEENDDIERFKIQGYECSFNSKGKGKGLAVYFKESMFKHQLDITEELFQLSIFSSDQLNLFVLYRSQGADQKILIDTIQELMTDDKPTLIIGDFNLSFSDGKKNSTLQYFHQNSFQQLVQEPTHLEGNIIDQALIKDDAKINSYKATLHTMYFTDHRAIAVLISR